MADKSSTDKRKNNGDNLSPEDRAKGSSNSGKSKSDKGKSGKDK